MAESIKGACNCGAVRFIAIGPFRPPRACHCRSCRRQSGHYLAATRTRTELIEVSGSENLTWYHATPDARRGFCKFCGTHLFWERPGSGFRSILMGSLDNSGDLQLRDHIFVAEKGDYYTIEDELPQFARDAAHE